MHSAVNVAGVEAPVRPYVVPYLYQYDFFTVDDLAVMYGSFVGKGFTLETGVPIETISRILGHSNIHTNDPNLRPK